MIIKSIFLVIEGRQRYVLFVYKMQSFSSSSRQGLIHLPGRLVNKTYICIYNCLLQTCRIPVFFYLPVVKIWVGNVLLTRIFLRVLGRVQQLLVFRLHLATGIVSEPDRFICRIISICQNCKQTDIYFFSI